MLLLSNYTSLVGCLQALFRTPVRAIPHVLNRLANANATFGPPSPAEIK
jgi:hypothetical protein